MDEATTDLRLLEPASPESLIPGTPAWMWIAGATLATLLILLLMRRLLRNRKTKQPLIHTREAAMREAMNQLDSIPLTNPRDTATQISLVLRAFLAATTRDPALYETHEEFVMRHNALQSLSETTRARSHQTFYRLASLKYAPKQPHIDPATLISDARHLLQTLYQEVPA